MMEIIDEEAPTLDELKEKIRIKHGDRAELISVHTTTKGGILGWFGKQVVRGQFTIPDRNSARGGYRSVVHGAAAPVAPIAPSVSVIDQSQLEAEKKKILGTVQQDKDMKAILDTMQQMNRKLDENRLVQDGGSEHATLRHIRKLLEKNDFSSDYIRDMISRIENELPVKALDDYDSVRSRVQEWVSDSISIDADPERRPGGPNVIILVGPTGVGKTTTIAKLAANLTIGQENGGVPVKTVMFTIDTYRIGAKIQIEKYGEIMEVPVKTINSRDDLKKQLLFHQDADYILIDTIGKSPKDSRIYSEMKEMLEVCRDDSDIYLAVSASTKSSDIADIIRNFEIFNYRSVILTKLDETYRVGNIISILSQAAKKLAYITTGQSVPQDIEPASRRTMLKNLEGFKSRSGKPEELKEVNHD